MLNLKITQPKEGQTQIDQRNGRKRLAHYQNVAKSILLANLSLIFLVTTLRTMILVELSQHLYRGFFEQSLFGQLGVYPKYYFSYTDRIERRIAALHIESNAHSLNLRMQFSVRNTTGNAHKLKSLAIDYFDQTIESEVIKQGVVLIPTFAWSH